MGEDKIKILSDEIVAWAKEQGKNSSYTSTIEILKNEDVADAYDALVELDDFVAQAKAEILNLNDRDLRKLEDLLLHIPEERGFTRGQILMLNSIRSIVFIEQNNRRGVSPIEPEK